MLLPDLLHTLADLTALEPRPEAQATAQALRVGARTDFPEQPQSALSEGILHTASLPGHPAARLIHDAHRWLPWQDSPIAAQQPDQLRAIKSAVTLLGPSAPIPSETLLFGLFYQAPHAYYPSTPTTRPRPTRSSQEPPSGRPATTASRPPSETRSITPRTSPTPCAQGQTASSPCGAGPVTSALTATGCFPTRKPDRPCPFLLAKILHGGPGV